MAEKTEKNPNGAGRFKKLENGKIASIYFSNKNLNIIDECVKNNKSSRSSVVNKIIDSYIDGFDICTDTYVGYVDSVLAILAKMSAELKKNQKKQKEI